MTLDIKALFTDGGTLGRRMLAHDWARSPIGPAEEWPIALMTLVGVMLGAKQPMYAAWGPELTMIYNDAYGVLLGRKDADALGRPFLDVWSEIRDDIQPLVDATLAGGSVHMDDITLMVDRGGQEEEAHFAFSYTPVRGDDGEVQGLFCACSDTTETVMVTRRQAFRLALEDALRGIEEADIIVRTAGRVLGEALGANRVGYGEVSEDGAEVMVESAYTCGMDVLTGTFPLEGFGKAASARLRRGETVSVADVAEEADCDPALWAATQVRSYLSVPILRGGKLDATLFVNATEPRHWSAENVAHANYVASRIGDALQRARAEEDARASARRFRALTEAIPNQVWTARTDGIIDWFNERTADFIGASPGVSDGKFDGEGWDRMIHPDDRALADERWTAALATGDVYEVEYRIRRVDGVYRWHLVRGVPERDFGGTVTRWVGTNTDIDDQKRAELDLVAAKAAADEANLAKSTFIANMSHELRTPLSAIIGYSEMMAEEIADGCSADDVAADLAKVENNARHLLGLINDVLDLSKIESGKMEAYAEEFEVEPVLQEIATTAENLLAKKGNRFQLEIGRGVGVAHTDLVKLRQILLNLLSNAAKFTEAGTVTLSARREPGPAGDQLVFVVHDTGIGMSPEQLERLFQRFSQADASTTRRFGGTGLGLSLTKAFSEMLGGSVAVESTEGQGSAFTLTLPARYTAEAADHEHAIDSAPAAVVPSENLVLVIDDDADQRTLMTRFLKREGFEVQVAADGRSGLALAKQLKPRAVMLDVLMPGVDGWSVLSQIKADPELTDIPVVMVTSVDQRSLAASLGASEYMLKPVQWDRFRSVMERFRTTRGNILLVEDDDAARRMIRTVLEDDGWTVTEAGNGQEGLEQATASRPDTVLMDLNMPTMNGFDFLDQLRQLPGCEEIPVVVLTARDLNREDRRRLRGVSQVLNKGDVSMRGLVHRLYRLAEQAGRAGVPVSPEAR